MSLSELHIDVTKNPLKKDFLFPRQARDYYKNKIDVALRMLQNEFGGARQSFYIAYRDPENPNDFWLSSTLGFDGEIEAAQKFEMAAMVDSPSTSEYSEASQLVAHALNADLAIHVVVFSESQNVESFALANNTLKPMCKNSLMISGQVSNFNPFYDPSNAKMMASFSSAIRENRALLMRFHGAIVRGSCFESALFYTVMLHRAINLQLQLMSNDVSRLISKAEQNKIKARLLNVEEVLKFFNEYTKT